MYFLYLLIADCTKAMIIIIVIQIAVWAPFTFIAIIIFTVNEVQQSRHYLLSSSVSI